MLSIIEEKNAQNMALILFFELIYFSVMLSPNIKDGLKINITPVKLKIAVKKLNFVNFSFKNI